jgi:hypothetical protein
MLQFILFIIVCTFSLFFNEPIYFGGYTVMTGFTSYILLVHIPFRYSCCANLTPFYELATGGGYMSHLLL